MSDGYSVRIIDMFHYDEEEDYFIGDFPTFELAKEFARRWVRDSVEGQRKSGQSGEELRRMWYMFGEDASVIGGEPHYAGSHELDFFVSHPATEEERDWKTIKRLAGLE